MRHAVLPIICAGAIVLTGCASNIRDFNRPPEMSPVGTGVGHNFSVGDPSNYPVQPGPQKYSLWQDRQASFFRDPRATNPGDVLTVIISINDRATLDNKSNRSRVS
ncbi:MAG: flagellar basal body L-ring protein FlgH, partial [Phyllobacterium sp.]